MATINPELSRIINDYFSANGGPDSAKNALRSAIESSNTLCQLLNTAATDGVITKIQPNTNLDAAATFGDGALSINTGYILDTPPLELAATLAHEIQHGFDKTRLANADSAFQTNLQQIAQQAGIKDYTVAVQTYATERSITEARAEISAWNAVVDKLTQKNGGDMPTLQQIYTEYPSAKQYIDSGSSFSLKPGIVLDGGMKMSLSADGSSPNQNEQAFAGYFFYTKPSYLASVLGVAMVWAQSPSSLPIDLTQLGFSVGSTFLTDPGSLKALTVDLNSWLNRSNSPNGTYQFTDTGSNQSVTCTRVGTSTTCENPGANLSVKAEAVGVGTVITTANGSDVNIWKDNDGDGTKDYFEVRMYTDATRTVLASERTEEYDYATGTLTTSVLNYNPGGVSCTFDRVVTDINTGTIQQSLTVDTNAVTGMAESVAIVENGELSTYDFAELSSQQLESYGFYFMDAVEEQLGKLGLTTENWNPYGTNIRHLYPECKYRNVDIDRHNGNQRYR